MLTAYVSPDLWHLNLSYLNQYFSFSNDLISAIIQQTQQSVRAYSAVSEAVFPVIHTASVN